MTMLLIFLWIQDNFGKKIVDKRLTRIKEKILYFINEDTIPTIRHLDDVDRRSLVFDISPHVSIDNTLSKKNILL